MTDATYRSLLMWVTGTPSNKDMIFTERNAVIDEMVRLGFKEANGRDQAFSFTCKPQSMCPMLRKVGRRTG